MKKLIYVIVILSSLQQYAQTQKGIQNGIFEHLKTNAIILTDEGIIRGSSKVKKIHF